MRKARRLVFLYSPAAICALWAFAVIFVGRSDGLVIGGMAALALSLLVHTCQVVSDYHRRESGRRGRRHT